MQTIGERLEEARKRKGISIREASEATKIRSDYLAKFEGNNFDIGLPDIYSKGFLRTYANYLKVNTDKLLTDYAALGLGKSRDARREGRDFLGRIDLPETSSSGPIPDEQAVRDAAQAPRTAPPARPGTASSASSIATDRGQLVKIGIAAAIAVVAIVVLLLVVQMLSRSPTPGTATPSTNPPPQSNPATSPALSNVVTLIARDTVKVTVVQKTDGTVLFNDTLARGERRAIARRGAISISYDVGANLQLEKNGERFNMTATGAGRNTVD